MLFAFRAHAWYTGGGQRRSRRAGFTSLQAARGADGEVIDVGVWKPISCGDQTFVQSSVVEDKEFVFLGISPTGLVCALVCGYGVVGAFSPSMVLMIRCSLPTKSLFFLELLRPSDRLHDHRSCIGNTIFRSACMDTGFLASTSPGRPVLRGVYDDVNGAVTRHGDTVTEVFRTTLELQRSGHAYKSIPKGNQGCRRVHGQRATTLFCMTHRTGSEETVAFESGLHGHSFLWLPSPTSNASHPQTNLLCDIVKPQKIIPSGLSPLSERAR